MSLQYSIQPSVFGKFAKTGYTYSPREHIKTMLNLNQNIRSTIDPLIQLYLEAQCEFMANYVAYFNATQQIERINAMRSKFPNEKIEVLLLKRHEVCSNFNKGFGFNPDTGLDALHLYGEYW